jgi:hypothetical protein
MAHRLVICAEEGFIFCSLALVLILFGFVIVHDGHIDLEL